MKRGPARALAEDLDYRSTAGPFRAISDKHALRIALELSCGEMSLSSMARKMQVRPEKLFREVLKMVGLRLVHARRQDERILYSLEYDEIAHVLDLMRTIPEVRLNRSPSRNSDGDRLRFTRRSS